MYTAPSADKTEDCQVVKASILKVYEMVHNKTFYTWYDPGKVKDLEKLTQTILVK